MVARWRAVGDAVDHEATGAADAFAAIVLEGDRLFALFDQLFIQHIEAFENRHVGVDIVHYVADELARLIADSSAATH